MRSRSLTVQATRTGTDYLIRAMHALGPTSTLSLPVVPRNIGLTKFYNMLGPVINQTNGQELAKFTPYQHAIWQDHMSHRYELIIKAQKLGISTSELIYDTYAALTYAMGREVLIVAQNKEMAGRHLNDIQSMIRRSPVLHDYLIENPPKNDKDLMRLEGSKVGTLYLRNPLRPWQPTQIIALSFADPGNLISFKKVAHIHMSDVAAAKMVPDRMEDSYRALRSRLVNTRGTMCIETLPRGPHGFIYNIASNVIGLANNAVPDVPKQKKNLSKNGFVVRRYTYLDGIEHGLYTAADIEQERIEYSELFGMYYEGSFYSSDKTWFNTSDVSNVTDKATQLYAEAWA